jgi:phosphohistidine phosphatase SixA
MFASAIPVQCGYHTRDVSHRRWTLPVRLLLAVLLLLPLSVGAKTLAGGQVLLLRHAEAPGTGDPEGFRLGDCSTQRNLSEAGRLQARAIGDWLREQGIERARVYSSQWCRCLETAELLGFGPVAELPGLNSFFNRPQEREPNLAALRRFLEAQRPSEDLLILVTHQVTISALTGEYTASGHGVLATLDQDGALRTVRRISFAE